jgi:hypothetical protein
VKIQVTQQHQTPSSHTAIMMDRWTCLQPDALPSSTSETPGPSRHRAAPKTTLERAVRILGWGSMSVALRESSVLNFVRVSSDSPQRSPFGISPWFRSVVQSTDGRRSTNAAEDWSVAPVPRAIVRSVICPQHQHRYDYSCLYSYFDLLPASQRSARGNRHSANSSFKMACMVVGFPFHS